MTTPWDLVGDDGWTNTPNPPEPFVVDRNTLLLAELYRLRSEPEELLEWLRGRYDTFDDVVDDEWGQGQQTAYRRVIVHLGGTVTRAGTEAGG